MHLVDQVGISMIKKHTQHIDVDDEGSNLLFVSVRGVNPLKSTAVTVKKKARELQASMIVYMCIT